MHAIAPSIPERHEIDLEPESWEDLFLGGLFILLHAGGGLTVFQTILLPSSSSLENTEGSRIVQAVWSSLYLIVFALLWKRRRRIVPVLRRTPWLLGLLGLALVSTLWSGFPALTFRRTVALAGTTATGLTIAVVYTPRQFLHILARALAVVALASICLALVAPEWGVGDDTRADAWTGLYSHKNHLAKAMLLGVLAWGVEATQRTGWGRILALGWVGICFVVFIKSHSATSNILLLALVLFAGLSVLARYTPSRSVLWSSLFVVFFLILAFVLWDPRLPEIDAILYHYAGRDRTLTGRTVLWHLLLQDIRESPLVGYGYSAYWLGDRGPSEATLLTLRQLGIYDRPTHSHNGYIDLAINLGLLGLLLFVFMMVVALVRAWRVSREGCRWEDHFHPVFLVLFLGYNFSERQILMYHSAVWAILCATVFTLARETEALRRTTTLPLPPARPAPHSREVPCASPS